MLLRWLAAASVAQRPGARPRRRGTPRGVWARTRPAPAAVRPSWSAAESRRGRRAAGRRSAVAALRAWMLGAASVGAGLAVPVAVSAGERAVRWAVRLRRRGALAAASEGALRWALESVAARRPAVCWPVRP